MAAEEPTCPHCGKPLLGRDRFEGQCAACREKEVLGEPSPPEDAELPPEPGTTCPSCGTENPVGLEHCMTCDARLRPRRWRAVALAAVTVVVVLAAAAYAVVAFWPGPPEQAAPRAARPTPRAQAAPATPTLTAAPDTRTPAPRPSRAHLAPRVREETRVLVGLLRERSYERVIDNYCQPDEEAFGRVEALLEQILHGDAKAGLLRWTAQLTRLDEAKAREQLTKAGDPHPEYTAALLMHLARDPDASGGHHTAEDRARSLLAWHLAGLFEGLDLARAEIRSTDDPGHGPFVVELDCGGAPRQPRPGDDPRRICWARRPVGWVLQRAVADRLADVHALLRRAAAP